MMLREFPKSGAKFKSRQRRGKSQRKSTNVPAQIVLSHKPRFGKLRVVFQADGACSLGVARRRTNLVLSLMFPAVSGRRVGLLVIATCLFAYACGPSAIADRALERAVIDAGRTPDVPVSRPDSRPPPDNNQPSQPIDPVGFVDGFVCKKDSDCQSGHCADGVCCQSTCDGLCESCDQEGKFGQCLPVPGGQDPDEECAQEEVSTCGRDGACNGARACRRYPADTVCVAGGCEVATERSARLCDGEGTCMTGTVKNCAPAECLGDACGPPCMMDTDCPSGRWCDKGTCRTQREQGEPCERKAQCGSGFCTDGVCCSMACEDQCYACNLEGSVGACKAIADGQDPGNECPVEAIGNCGNGGGCNGRGGCRKHPTGTFCGYGGCTNGTQYGNSTCDGMGNCRRGPGRSCGAYACNGNLVCWGACSNDMQCASGRHCNVHACQ
jgi:hypothetical protein